MSKTVIKAVDGVGLRRTFAILVLFFFFFYRSINFVGNFRFSALRGFTRITRRKVDYTGLSSVVFTLFFPSIDRERPFREKLEFPAELAPPAFPPCVSSHFQHSEFTRVSEQQFRVRQSAKRRVFYQDDCLSF